MRKFSTKKGLYKLNLLKSSTGFSEQNHKFVQFLFLGIATYKLLYLNPGDCSF